jgi:type III secretory pathway component EscU
MVRMNELPALVQIIAVVALIAGISAIILDEFQESAASSSADVNQTLEDGIGGLTEVTSWLDLVALAVMAGILLVIVIGSVGTYMGRRGGY